MATRAGVLLMLTAWVSVTLAEDPRSASHPESAAEQAVPKRATSSKDRDRLQRLHRGKQAPAPATPTTGLDLKLGNALQYFDAEELERPLDERLEEVIVNGQRLEPLPDRRNVPMGVFPSLGYAAKNPLDVWRIIAPVPNFQIPDRNVDDDAREPPGAYRGRILEPGAIYD